MVEWMDEWMDESLVDGIELMDVSGCESGMDHPSE